MKKFLMLFLLFPMLLFAQEEKSENLLYKENLDLKNAVRYYRDNFSKLNADRNYAMVQLKSAEVDNENLRKENLELKKEVERLNNRKETKWENVSYGLISFSSIEFVFIVLLIIFIKKMKY